VSEGTEPTSDKDEVGEATKFVGGTHPTGDKVGGGGKIKAVVGVGKRGNVELTAVPESSSLRSSDSTAKYARLNVDFLMTVFLKRG
jgi:hypothetical protein